MMTKITITSGYLEELRQHAIKIGTLGQWSTIAMEVIAELQEKLLKEKADHQSCIDAVKGIRHAWYCESQISGCKCNCGYEK